MAISARTPTRQAGGLPLDLRDQLYVALENRRVVKEWLSTETAHQILYRVF